MSEDSELEKRSRELLREAADNLDGRVRSRLTQARHAAVEEARKARSATVWRTWLPAGAVAATAVLAAILWTARPLNGPDPSGSAADPLTATSVPTAIDDLELLSASESFELLEELEFYDWLEPAPRRDGGVS